MTNSTRPSVYHQFNGSSAGPEKRNEKKCSKSDVTPSNEPCEKVTGSDLAHDGYTMRLEQREALSLLTPHPHISHGHLCLQLP